jgi:hypothetical protein
VVNSLSRVVLNRAVLMLTEESCKSKYITCFHLLNGFVWGSST